MRIFGLLGLVVALAIVGWIARRQLTDTRIAPPVSTFPATGAAGGNTAAQIRQVPQQYKELIENSMQQPAREVPADAQ